ncbi:holo-ACP synthase [Candidatus Phytoplasma luffae]|uniref:citrate lyase holo-[acyl-carrier protein] synthase n=1 Tax=Loofah witches'-broom phytoplasma TaxID=35773 RepID=A0A975INB9_LOWBP|nr:citrate lyase holo-[acyl-carrier protein] synthase [Candidatus Phytoplasma luffae]QTX02691.1 holo-ACP synthase [Candidatus Phytoplasma luffae]
MKIKILISREKRYLKQKEILNKYQKGLLTANLNIPGINKNKPLYDMFFKKIINKILLPFLQNLKIIYSNEKQVFLKDYAGIYLNIILNTGNENLLKIIKNKLIELEEKEFILIFLDFDLINIKHEYIKREFLNKKRRICFLCNRSAKICVIQQNHSLQSLLNFIEQKMKIFLSRNNSISGKSTKKLCD